LLGHGSATAKELDTRIEAWLKNELKITADFEVEDALAKLERFGLVTRDGERWAALPIDQALNVLERRWGAALGV
jgi:hypothetical protein